MTAWACRCMRLAAARIRATPDYSLREAARWLQNGTVVAFAGGRQRLAAGARNMPGLRLLADNLYGVPQTIAVPLDRADRLALVNAALDELRANSFLAGLGGAKRGGRAYRSSRRGAGPLTSILVHVPLRRL